MAYRDSTTGSGITNTPAVPVPAGVQIGDIVILACGFDDSTASFDPADWPTGFTELDEVQITADGHKAAVAWKRLTAADTGTYDLAAVATGGHDWVCQAIALSGRHATNPPVISTVASSNAANASPITITANGVTAVAGDDLVWISVPDVNAEDIGNGHTPPTNFTEAEDAEERWANLSIAYRENVSAGATGSIAGTFALTSGGAGWAAWTVRIPAAAGGGSDTSLTPSQATATLTGRGISMGFAINMPDEL